MSTDLSINLLPKSFCDSETPCLLIPFGMCQCGHCVLAPIWQQWRCGQVYMGSDKPHVSDCLLETFCACPSRMVSGPNTGHPTHLEPSLPWWSGACTHSNFLALYLGCYRGGRKIMLVQVQFIPRCGVMLRGKVVNVGRLPPTPA
jgi:hypothetical protein